MDSTLSRSEKKRRAKDVEQLVHELALLTANQIGQLPCSGEIQDEILAAGNLKGSARKRQLKYAARLLRDRPVEELFDFLARRKGSQLKQKREFHNLEHLRDLLLNEIVARHEENLQSSRYIDDHEPVDFSWPSDALAVIADQLPGIDLAALKNTAIQFARTRNRKFSRELFRILRASFEKQQYKQGEYENNGI